MTGLLDRRLAVRKSVGPLLALAIAWPGALGLLGCATTAPKSGAPLDQQVQELRAQLVSLQRKNTVTEIELQRLRVKVAELEVASRKSRVLAPVMSSTEDHVAPSLRQKGPEDPIEASPRGHVESADLTVRDELQAVNIGDIDRPDPESKVAASSSAAGSTSDSVLSEAAQALYDQGYVQYNQGQFVAAEATFQRYLQRYRTTSLADNAQYWIGEARYSRGDARGALAAYRETVARYPEGNKAPDALLRSGRVYEELGDQESALESYNELVRRFPSSADALLAGDRIRALGGL